MTNKTVCGYVAIVGRPNVGKSTLLNGLLGQKISITAPKPQTTRHRLLGVKTTADIQMIYVDTPGLHRSKRNALNRHLNRTAVASIEGVDVVLWLVEALQWREEDDYVRLVLERCQQPVILGVNKIDKVKNKAELLPYLQEVALKRTFTEMFPISAYRGDNLPALEAKMASLLPDSVFLFPPDQITDRSSRFFAGEMIREKLIRHLAAELPYRLSVQIEHFSTDENLVHISAIIWVEKSSQKAIVIGSHGQQLKIIGESARQDIEILLESKVFLQLWVKVKEKWSNNEQALQQLGIKLP
ncbi:MAG: GTPase Era [Beggiatoa sp. IS2]|nr:MAG: GTPase Era [Beggiatoa sp. IS2]